MAKFLVTGGAGFIGSNIVEKLLGLEHEVVVFDNFLTGKKSNLEELGDKIKIIEGDIRDYEAIRNAMQGIDFVLHQAALPSVPRSLADPKTTHDINVNGTFNVLLAAREAKIKRLVYASSSSVYGDAPELPKKEDFLPRPKSPYAVSKLTGEYYCQVFYKNFGLETVILRYFNVFGPRQDPASQYAAAIPKFIKALQKGISPMVFGDGEQSRDFTYVDNVVAANIKAAATPNIAGEIFNVACGKAYSVNKVLELLGQILNKPVKPDYVASRPGDVKHSLADISKIKEKMGYIPVVEFKEGLMRTVKKLLVY